MPQFQKPINVDLSQSRVLMPMWNAFDDDEDEDDDEQDSQQMYYGNNFGWLPQMDQFDNQF